MAERWVLLTAPPCHHSLWWGGLGGGEDVGTAGGGVHRQSDPCADDLPSDGHSSNGWEGFGGVGESLERIRTLVGADTFGVTLVLVDDKESRPRGKMELRWEPEELCFEFRIGKAFI